MTPVSHVNAGAARPLTEAGKPTEAAGTRQAKEESPERPHRPVMDRYTPEQGQQPWGRYWLGRDQDGQPRICFDDPKRAADSSEPPEGAPAADAPAADESAKGPEKPEKENKKEEIWSANTDGVDREIERLKSGKQQLERQSRAETDENRARELQRQLDQIERELSAKDNDAYRRQRAVFTRLS